MRARSIRVAVNPAVAGSAEVSLGATTVVASTPGPRDATRPGAEFSPTALLHCDVRFAPFAAPDRPFGGFIDRERALSARLVDALTPVVLLARFPKSSIDVNVLVLAADGGELAACVIAAVLALADAGVDLRDVAAAATVACCPRDDTAAASGGTSELIVDPTAAQLAKSTATTTVVLLPQCGTLSTAVHTGAATPLDVVAALSAAMEATVPVFVEMKAALAAAATAADEAGSDD